MSCDSNERHTPDVANPAEDLIAHSLKKGEEQANIPPKKIGSSPVCDRNTQKKPEKRNTGLKKTGIAPIV